MSFFGDRLLFIIASNTLVFWRLRNAIYLFSDFLITRLLKQLESGEDVSAASVVSGATPVPGTSGGAQAGMVAMSSKFVTSVSVREVSTNFPTGVIRLWLGLLRRTFFGFEGFSFAFFLISLEF